MRTRLLNNNSELAKVFGERCGKADDIRIVTAWATADCIVCDRLTDARDKIATMVVGLDFYTTSPDFLKQFRSVIRIGEALDGGTFHPKLYLFENGDGFCCVMGSSNFTNGGFGNNAELNICIEGGTSDAFYKQVSTYIDNQEKKSYPLRTPELADYREQFEKFKAQRRRLAKFRPSDKAKTKVKEHKEREMLGEEP
jgi:HKD family nuclease